MPVIIGFIFSSLLFSAQLKIIGPCSKEPLRSWSENIQERMSVGDWTVQLLEKHEIPYKGYPNMIMSIFNTPTGDKALEVLSDYEMLSYGWCYSLNGKVLNQFADQIILNNEDKIVWFYGYAHYDRGVWKDLCAPSYKRKSPFICSQDSQ